MFTKEIATALGCDPKNINDVEITETTVDSRSVTAPASALFFALRGVNHDGHDYIPALYARGCRNFVVGAWRGEFDALTGANFFRVLDVRAALQSLAAWRRSRLRADVVAVTGSNGKTIVKEWIYQLLASEPGIYRSPRSYNSQIGVPLSVLGIEEQCRLAVIEAGISQPGEMERLEEIIRPRVGIFTHLGDAHSENFESQEQKLCEKARLFRRCEVVIGREGAVLDAIMQELPPAVRCLAWGTGEGADVRILSDRADAAGRSLELQWQGKAFSLRIPFADEASFENALHAVSLLLFLGRTPESIAAGVARLQPIAMRMEIKDGINRCVLINDYYNSDAASFQLALNTLAMQDAGRRNTSFTVRWRACFARRA